MGSTRKWQSASIFLLTSALWIFFGVGSSPLELPVIVQSSDWISEYFFLWFFLTILSMPQVSEQSMFLFRKGRGCRVVYKGFLSILLQKMWSRVARPPSPYPRLTPRQPPSRKFGTLLRPPDPWVCPGFERQLSLQVMNLDCWSKLFACFSNIFCGGS